MIIRYDEEARVWVSYCRDRDIYSQGRTKAEAQEALDAARKTYDCVIKKRYN